MESNIRVSYLIYLTMIWSVLETLQTSSWRCSLILARTTAGHVRPRGRGNFSFICSLLLPKHLYKHNGGTSAHSVEFVVPFLSCVAASWAVMID